ncbi:MAG: hypothetical protein NEA02_12290, partial [Thermoanaerobaculia bacterium]|nr:hypothetical protein [Thermoanaerobaculia bacterium]
GAEAVGRRLIWAAILDDIVPHMKTTVEISDPLMREARAAAVREGRTLRSLLEEGLREVLAGRRRKGRFRLRDGSFKGKGVQPGVDLSNWDQIRSLIYEGRGG